MTFLWPKIKAVKKIKPMRNTTPWVWVIEPSHGCNLACGHCCAELIPEERKQLMTIDSWRSTFQIIQKVSPTVRVDIGGVVGEPTLHPELTDWLKEARRIAPWAQIQITTNGTRILSGEVPYKALLEAGANIVYTDQYGSHEEFERLAQESGYRFYQYYDKPEGAWSPWSYIGPHMKMIVLMEHPGTWPKSRFKAGLLGNWYGNLNWQKAARFHMQPLEEPLTRRCNQPFLYVTVAASGEYLLCCQDGMHVTEGMFGNVSEGLEGFRAFWYGDKLQTIRMRLRNKDRAGTAFACAKCNITFSRCDLKHWTEAELAFRWE